MKIGLIPQFYGADSLKYVWASIEKALSARHEVIYRPLEYFNTVRSRQPEILKELFGRCDVLMGHIEKEVLECREKFGKPLPLLGVLFGTMSRGGADLANVTQYLKTTDMLIGNCAGDLEIARKFFRNAETRLLPFVYDQTTFYQLEPERREAIKAKMGIGEKDKVLLYAGRVTIEKNVHTVLSVFRVLQNLIPNLHLIVVGDGWDVPFRELGVYTFGMTGVLHRLGHKLGIDEKRVHVVRGVGADTLRNLYNVADAAINFTLHHDENFGLSQVEAMACGTPVIGTRWGGLKDTIIDGQTGFHVSTVVTPSGVKVDWWEGVNKIYHLLADPAEHEKFRRQAKEHAVVNYSMENYQRKIESLLSDCMEINKKPSETIELTSFAREYWDVCGVRPGDRPPYQRGPKAFQMYRELIEPFTGMTGRAFNNIQRLQPNSVLCLESPVRISEEGRVTINDPLYPFDFAIPDEHREAIVAALKAFTKEPAMTFERLVESHLKEFPDYSDAIAWILKMGLALGTDPDCGSVDPLDLSPIMGTPMFTIREIDYTTDVLVIR